MTAVLARLASERPDPELPVHRGRVLRDLAGFEAVRLLRSPVMLVAAVLFLTPWLYGWVTGSADRFPVLADEVVLAQVFALLILGSAAMVAANLAALRAHRHGADALFDVLVLPPAWRTGALLLAVLAPTLLAAVLVGVRAGVVALLPGTAGHLLPAGSLWADLLTGPAVVALLGAVGVLLARLTHSAVVAPLAVVGLATCAFIAPVSAASTSVIRLLLPVVGPEFPMAVPAEILGRPAGRHLVYVVGLVALVALLALFRSGARRLVVPAALALVVAVGGGATQLHVDDGLAAARRTATDHPAPMQTCRVLGDVRYCAFDDFTPWISDWDAVLRSVRRAVPAKATHPASGPVLTVRQRVLAVGRPAADDVVSAEDIQRRATIDRRADAAAGTPEAISAGTAWGDSRAAAVFAAAVAYRLITGRAWLGGPAVCGARGALLVWLVGQGSARTAEGLRKLDAASWGGLAFGDGGSDGWIDVPDPDAAAGLALLHRPSSQARAAVLAHWDELSAATTDADRFAALVGVPATPQPPVRERAACDR